MHQLKCQVWAKVSRIWNAHYVHLKWLRRSSQIAISSVAWNDAKEGHKVNNCQDVAWQSDLICNDCKVEYQWVEINSTPIVSRLRDFKLLRTNLKSHEKIFLRRGVNGWKPASGVEKTSQWTDTFGSAPCMIRASITEDWMGWICQFGLWKWRQHF